MTSEREVGVGTYTQLRLSQLVTHRRIDCIKGQTDRIDMAVLLSLDEDGEALSLASIFRESPVFDLLGALSIVVSACYSYLPNDYPV